MSMLAIALGTLGASAAGVAKNEVLYFNLSKNTSWYTSGSGTLYARFFNGSTPVGNVVCSLQATNIYKATAPAAATHVQLAVYNSSTMKDLVLNDAKAGRVYFDNTSNNWGSPYAYNWKDGSTNTGAWPGKAMSVLSGKMYYYDYSYKYIIFSNNGSSKTADLTVPDDLAYWNGSGWTDVFTSSTSKIDLSSKPSSANEIYLEGTNLTLSKYQYPSHTNYTARHVYVYNPNWTGTNIYVQYDLSDPYQKYFAMTKVSGKPAGFYEADVPENATFKFFATQDGVGGSNETQCSADTALNCYKMGSGAERWVKLEEAQKVTSDYYADKSTSGYDNSSAFWVDATYYDYLSDTELNNGWLKPSKVGTWYTDSQHLADDNWYPFYQFNSYINGKTSGVSYPLFFGNFCNTDGSYPWNYLRNGGYGKAIENLSNFNYIANNSNGLPSYNYSVQNLAKSSLSADGDILFPNGTKMPYFQQKTADDGYAKTVQSYFPFRSTTTGTGNNQVTQYFFNSNNATDNVFFKWSNGKPTSVNYGKNTGYGVKDGLADFNYDDYNNNQYRGYGIFPFNNKDNGNGNPGNGNLDYGFGVRMDMNFRVPANGKLPNGSDVKFTFTGDDDLWVYISPVNDDGTVDYANSKLALDLGGNHKKATGNINFNTMKYTITKGATIKSSTYTSEMMVIKDTSSWGQVSLWAWSDSYGGEWFDGVSIGNNEYAFKASATGSSGHKFGEMKYFFVNKGRSWNTVVTNTFKKGDGTYEEWPGYTKTENGQDRTPFLVQSHFGRRTYIDHPSYMEDLSSNWRNAYDTKTDSFGMSQLDPTKMYHMTVFYMERGLIESNASMEFTMTPAQNDYKVEKIVNTAKVNSGVASAVKAKDKFNFTTAGTYAGSAVSRSDAQLGNNQVKDYSNMFDTNTNLKTTETGAVVSGTSTASNTQYTTTYVVADTDSGQIVKDTGGNNASGTGTATPQFLLKRQDTSLDSIHLKSTFTNTPVTSPLNIKKRIYEEDGTTLSQKIVSFNYTMEVDLDGSGNKYGYRTYPLDYTVGGHAAKMGSNGSFSFRSDQTVTVPNLPKNATFRITESKSAGFTAKAAVKTGTVGSTTTVTFDNVVTPSTDKIVGTKKLNGQNYTGNMFTFKLEGLAPPAGYSGTDTIKDESGFSANPVTNITNGAVEFQLSYDSDDVGIHRYKFYEDTQALAEYDAAHGTTYATDIIATNSVYYVEVKVTRNGTDLEIEYIKYFRPVYSVTDPTDPTAPSDPDVDINATFEGQALDAAEFDNDVKPGSITVYKTDSANERVNDIWFHVYKVDGDRAAIPSGSQPVRSAKTSKQEAAVLDAQGRPTDVTEEQDGIAKLENLPIYKSANQACSTFSDDPYQWYCLVEEYSTSSGYNKNETKMYFRFPTEDKYDFVAPYLNGILKQPQTSGWGMNALKTVGITIIALSALGFGAYVLYVRKPGRGKRYKTIKK